MLIGAHDLRLHRLGGTAVIAGIADAGLAGLAFFRGDEDDTLRTGRTIDRGRGIFQEVKVLDQTRIQVLKILTRHDDVVDDIQRLRRHTGRCTGDGDGIPDIDVGRRSRLTRREADTDTRQAVDQRRSQVRHRQVLDLFRLDGGYGTEHIHFLLGAITHHHDVVELLVYLIQRNGNAAGTGF